MKIAKAVIEDFRHIERLELDFTDSLGRVRDLSLLVGPNTSGKTTVLDALAVAGGLSTELPYARPGFELTPRGIVRKGALHAKVTCEVRFTEDEVAATREVLARADKNWDVPSSPDVQIEWQYPDPRNKSVYGHTCYHPKSAWTLFKGRVSVARLLSTGRVDWSWFKRVGAVFTFDQQRTGMGKTIPRDIWNIIHGLGADEEPDGGRRTSDPRTILLAMAVQAHLPPVGKRDGDEFRAIQDKYAEICAPHRIQGAIRDELGAPDILFSDGSYEYRYDGLSSGEQMLLLFLIRMVTEHIHQSIVLVDEVELHQHPVWQRKLLHLLPIFGDGNQVIATTHSPYVRDAAPRGALMELGELGETPAKGDAK
ncbi:MAG: hypothetical protein FJ278_14040 [Planctomycetes bacterium]|nr:hypothetical protein [Planctomycetota bacterium]